MLLPRWPRPKLVLRGSLNVLFPFVQWQWASLGGDWWDGVFGDFAVVLLSKVGAVPSTTNAAYSAAWKMWVKWTQDIVKRSKCIFRWEFRGIDCGRDLAAFGDRVPGIRFRRCE